MNHKPLMALLVCATALLGALLCPPALAEETSADTSASGESSTLEFTAVDQIIGKKLGMLNGGAFDTILLKNYPDVSQDDILYFNSNAETIQALKTGKIDAMISDLPIAQLAVSKNDGIGIMPEYLVEDHYAYILQKNSPLTAQINERIDAYREDGTIQKLYDKWTGSDDSVKTIPPEDWETPNGTLTVMTNADSEPMAYQVGNEATGMTIELLHLIARDLGYGLLVKPLSSTTLIAEVQSGKADIASSCFSITEERKQVVDMTDPFYDGGMVAIVRDTAGGSQDVGFLEGIVASFNRTFLVENRWQLILSGLGVTLVISMASGVAGLALGFLFVILRRKKENGLAQKLIGLLEKVLGGLPVVVVLMVFYYIFFGAIDISGMVVAILAFSLIFGTASGSIMWNSIRAVDAGQTEAGRALGFGDRDTFTLVVLPQAARQFAPLLLSQFVSLIKDTSIVGYIAVQDLTRVGDLIRARTMEAFFPLIAIAIIYFVFCRLMAWALSKLTKKLEPKDGPRTIKGVEL
ncbi:MAG: ABC transporter substrate-binding protein/permease [Coriobacteriales bacterium]|nr:ABC transporter substrate-binding protein/permease [Coriobacteriales bacterium]